MMITNPLVSVNWLYNNIDNKKLIVLDCSMLKVTDKESSLKEKTQIMGAVFFDIKNIFSDQEASFPNTILSPKEFEEKAQKLGVNKDSIIVCYDDIGIYSSPRVWWMFTLMGFKNIAVLDGGLPAWKLKKYPVEIPQKHQLNKGNFKVKYNPKKIKFTKDVLLSIENKAILIADARSKGRFLGTEKEPRNNVKSGHIPNSVNLPYFEVQANGKMKSLKELKKIFKELIQNKEEIIFSCGTGITASILALATELIEFKNYAVYDGSWTEWGSTNYLPIEL